MKIDKPTVQLSQSFTNATNANTVTLQSGVTSASYTLTLPTAVAAVTGYVLSSTDAGVLSWVAQPTVPVDGSGTTNELTYWVDSNTLGALAVTTYPSLTEMSYVKGLTSAVQSQLNAKAPTASPTFTGEVTIPNTGLHLLDTNASHDLIIAPGSNLTADKTLTITTGDADTNLDLTAVTDGFVLTYDTGTNSWRGEAGGAGGANTALSNLAAVAINTTLVSDTDNTDALGTAAISWSDLFLGDGSVITWSTAPSTADITLTHSANTLTLAGGDLVVPDEAYGAGWDNDLSVPTKNAIYDKIQTITGLTWTDVTGTSQVAAINNGYIANNAGLVTVTLPDTAAVGSIVRVAGLGAGGWKIAQNASEYINFGNQTTTTGVGGYLASVNRYDAVELLCVTANVGWVVISSQGNITVV